MGEDNQSAATRSEVRLRCYALPRFTTLCETIQGRWSLGGRFEMIDYIAQVVEEVLTRTRRQEHAKAKRKKD